MAESGAFYETPKGAHEALFGGCHPRSPCMGTEGLERQTIARRFDNEISTGEKRRVQRRPACRT